ncbi:MAG TPA: CGNR zinc finger domain-containing protein [Jiangellaceae bacterium]|nr:CGNR zinc finger domain-containing protein [Jiangellaceae bacterium]
MDGWLFIGGATCLDFLNTLRDRWAQQPTETLREPVDLAAWAVAAGLADELVPIDDAGLTRARAVRSTLFRLLTGGHGTSAADIAEFNELAGAAPRPTLVLPAGTDSPSVQRPRATTGSEILSLVVANALDVLAEHGPAPAKECEHERCGLRYLDISRGGRRRWCSMARCGNRVKVQRYDRRHQPT